MSQLHHVAIHEAGHAIIARVLGITINWVTIIPSDGFLGQCSMRWEPYARRYILALMAGHEAELEFLGSGNNDRADHELIAQAVRCQGLHEAPLRRQARRLVREHRILIERVAGALLERQTLTAHEVGELLARAEMDATYTRHAG